MMIGDFPALEEAMEACTYLWRCRDLAYSAKVRDLSSLPPEIRETCVKGLVLSDILQEQSMLSFGDKVSKEFAADMGKYSTAKAIGRKPDHDGPVDEILDPADAPGRRRVKDGHVPGQRVPVQEVPVHEKRSNSRDNELWVRLRHTANGKHIMEVDFAGETNEYAVDDAFAQKLIDHIMEA